MQTDRMPCRISFPKSEMTSQVCRTMFVRRAADRTSAQKFLSSLDDDPLIGGLIDQTMDYEYEQAQMLQKTGEDLSPEMWIMK